MAERFDREAVAEALRAEDSIAASARRLGVERRRLSEFVNADAELKAICQGPAAGTTSTVKGDEVQVSIRTESLEGGLDAPLRALGLAPDEFITVSVKTGETYHGEPRTTITFRRIAAIAACLPRAAEYKPVPKPRPVRRSSGPWECVIVADHQAPYTDDDLHAATLAMIRDKQPRRIGHIGDLCDYTNISRHNDHAVIKANVDECTDAGVEILASIRDAAPDAEFEILAGNHDIRPFSELLARAERLAGIRSGHLKGSPGRELVTLAQLWRLEELGITYVEDLRGWQHAELEIVPGDNGLVAVHGHLTGENVAKRTLAKVGRSVLMGHTHGPEHAWTWNKTIRREQQAMVVGAQCEVRGGKNFPTFAPRDGWLQGPALVTVWPDNEFTMQRVRWNGESLILNGDRWTP